MTFKNFNKSPGYIRKKTAHQGQSIFEYCILTATVVAIALFFTTSKFFTNPNPDRGEHSGIKEICDNAFNQAVEEMLQ